MEGTDPFRYGRTSKYPKLEKRFPDDFDGTSIPAREPSCSATSGFEHLLVRISRSSPPVEGGARAGRRTHGGGLNPP